MPSHLMRAACLPVLIAITGCAALKSVRHKENVSAPGLAYHLPNGRIRITLTVTKTDQGIGHAFKVDTLYYPDTSARYAVSIPKNYFGDTELDIKASSAGLLSSASYKYESRILEAIEAIPPVSDEKARIRRGACEPGVYMAVIAPPDYEGFVSKPKDLCGFTISVESLEEPERTPGGMGESVSATPRGDAGERTNGIYYRVNFPFLVEIRDKSEVVFSEIGLSPSHSPTLFVKLNRSLFAKSEGMITFDNGVLVQFAPKMKSEVESAFSLPAAIIKSYFDAISALFALRITPLASEANYLEQIEKTLRAKASLEKCQAAYASGDDERIESDCKESTE